MARLPRIVVPGTPHLVTQRGNRGEQTFFGDDDFALYRDLLAEAARNARAQIWAYCLMPNHVHIIITPKDEDGLRRTFADAHRRYTNFINTRMRVTGHLWQGRFGSVAMDEPTLAHALRYVSLNPVRAKLVKRATDWRWSSAKAFAKGKDDGLVTIAPVLKRFDEIKPLLKIKGPEDEEAVFKRLRQAESIGRPVGGEKWLKRLEKKLDKTLRPQKRGRKAKGETAKRSATP